MRNSPDDIEPPRRSRTWVAVVLLTIVALLALAAVLTRGDDGAEGQDRGSDASEEVADSTSDGDGADTDGDTLIIERDGEEVPEEDRVVSERRDGDTPEVEVTIDETEDLQRIDDLTIRVPTDTELKVTFDNSTDEAYNVYLELDEAGGVLSTELASMEPFVDARSMRDETFSTPPTASTYAFRVADEDGETLAEATLEVEDR